LYFSDYYLNPRVNQKPLTVDNRCWGLSDPYKCSYKDCNQEYWEEEALKRHEVFEHHILLSCPFDSECQQSGEKYHGQGHLLRHINTEHASLFPKPMCFDPNCTFDKPFKAWPAVIRHILKQHLEAVGLITNATTSSAIPDYKLAKRCMYENCNGVFKARSEFLGHLVTVHSYPLRCPYDPICNNRDKDDGGYLGLIELEQHIIDKHSAEFPRAACFSYRCQQKKHFNTTKQLMRHILKQHWLDVKIN
jgi:hypothetical protein